MAPILRSGLGNAMFQIAAVCMYAKEKKLPCYIGFWNHSKSKEHVWYLPYGGHPVHIALHDFFPNIDSLKFPANFALSDAQISFTDTKYIWYLSYVPMEQVFDYRQTPFVCAWFFNSRCTFFVHFKSYLAFD